MNQDAEIIKKGSAILTVKPFCYVLSSKQISRRCDNCLKSGKLLKCSGCRYAHYCNRDCQRDAWNIHKMECINLNRIAPRVIPDAARLMARIIVKLNQGGGEERGYYTDDSYRKFKDLMSHYSDLKQDETRMEHFTSLCGVLFEFMGKSELPNPAELMGIYGRMCVNSFNILDHDMNSIGVGIYLAPSIIDHSCRPNALAVFEGTTIIIRALEDVPRFDWTKIKISYIDLMNSKDTRQAELLNTYYFLCDCEKCKEPEPVVEAALCPEAACAKTCNINEKKCIHCGEEISEDFWKNFEDTRDFTAHHLQDMKTMAYLDISKMCLKRQKGVFHPLNLQHVRTTESAFDAAVSLEYWEEAEFYALQLIPGYLHYYDFAHPLTGLLYLMLGKIQLHLEKIKEALGTLKTANSILLITHGEKHSLIRESLRPLLSQAIAETRGISN
ncbi:histone-lysine N-methyltransferase SMYD3 isoform X2 [Belonocnema kinseyi]|uniref:histone-lysine N-methyltransferase SMYD3 isoform X2 n=1 Tax=Belonocnema kinseyi TaxID=2817044 RepID=UPI00143D643E|nr:histone-lysine N-methyltransferase SMYD3 isoform X2 [Belonocnema kinseyi]